MFFQPGDQTAGHLIGPHIEKSFNQEQYACAIRMIGELETAGHFATEKIFGPHIEKSVMYNFNLPVSI